MSESEFTDLCIKFEVRLEMMTEAAASGSLEDFLTCVNLCDCTVREMYDLLPPSKQAQ